MITLAKVRYGSSLYGTTVPTSDVDFRAVYLPPLSDLILQRAKDAWEDKTVDDTSIFSLQHFCRLAAQGQSIAIEMLAADGDNVVSTSPVWQTLHDNRKRFYTKSMHSFLGYSKSMSGKYSARIDRLNETAAILRVLDARYELDQKRFREERGFTPGHDIRLADIWEQLPMSINAEKGVNDRSSGTDKRVYRVCGRELQATISLTHAQSVVRGIYDSYGERVRKAKDGQIDHKALMHAFRAALQCREIVQTGDLKFPLRDAQWLTQLRVGQIDFMEHQLDRKLDELIAEVQVLMDRSSLPEKPDQAWIDRLVLSAYEL